METSDRKRSFPALDVGTTVGERLEAMHRATEIACFEHASSLGFGDEVVRPKGWMWLIAKTGVAWERPWENESEITVFTRPVYGASTGLLWVVQVWENDRILANQTIHWVLADQTTGKAIRWTDSPRGDREAFRRLERREFKLLEEDASNVLWTKQHLVSTNDLDENGHVHNTCHVRYTFDAIGSWPIEYAVKYHTPLSADIVLHLQALQGTNVLVLNGYPKTLAATPAFTVGVRVIK